MSEPATCALETRGIDVAYGAVKALDNVSLAVPTGAMAALVGPNGAGKSTLLKVVLGLIKADAGQVTLLGGPVREGRKRVGYVPQRSTVNWDFPADALDVVTMGLYPRLGLFRRPGRSERGRARAALEQVGMADLAQRPIGQLSGGQQQRVFLARALVQEPELFMLDEPLAGVDAASEAAIVSVLKDLNANGKTVVAVHHDLNTLTDYFDWLALLNVRLVAQGPASDVLASDAFERTYGAVLVRRTPLSGGDALPPTGRPIRAGAKAAS
ncbi:MAG TPA: metal ABC transporter ATP-binding protein [Trueperaceae bacterium]|nr:metal ABC transporter ATP-binding protein [Trueperaceae bacterium]